MQNNSIEWSNVISFFVVGPNVDSLLTTILVRILIPIETQCTCKFYPLEEVTPPFDTLPCLDDPNRSLAHFKTVEGGTFSPSESSYETARCLPGL
jgi:hypothetical protein